MIGAPRVPSRPFRTYRSTWPSGRHAGSWWPSGWISVTSGTVRFFVPRSRNWSTTSLLVGSGPSETIASVLPLGDSTGWRIHENQSLDPWLIRPSRTLTGSALPSALTRMICGIVSAQRRSAPCSGQIPTSGVVRTKKIVLPSGDQLGIESSPLFVSWCVSLPVWIQMLPVLAYTIEPGKAATSGTMTTFDGVGVRLAPGRRRSRSRCRRSAFDPPTNGTEPFIRLRVTKATMSKPTIERTGASQDPTGPSRMVALRGAGVAARVMKHSPRATTGAAATGGDAGRLQDRGRGRVGTGGRDVADVELERFEATERRLVSRATTSTPVALVDDLGDVAPPEGDAVEDVALAAQGQLGVAAGRRRGRGSRSGRGPRRAARGCPGRTARVPRARGSRRVVDVARPAMARSIASADARVGRRWLGGEARNRSRNAGQRSAGSSKPAAPA